MYLPSQTNAFRTYNITVNHRRFFLNTTKGHPARFNDKTLVLFDDLVNQLHNSKFDDVHEFTLMDFDQEGKITEVKYKGCYFWDTEGTLACFKGWYQSAWDFKL